MKRNATAVWNGTLEEGRGRLSTASGCLSGAAYDAPSRFGQGEATNPEELIAAAHAGCFAMALAHKLEDNGYHADTIEAKAVVELDVGRLEIVESSLECQASIRDIEPETFHKLAEEAKADCPVSKTLRASIRLDATLLPEESTEGESASREREALADAARERGRHQGYA